MAIGEVLIGKFRAVPIIQALAGILMLYPYVIWDVKYVVVVPVFLSLCLFVVSIIEQSRMIKVSDLLLFVAWFVFVIYVARVGYPNGMSLYGFLLLVSTCGVMFLITEDEKRKCFSVFSALFALSLVPGIIVQGIVWIGVPADTFFVDEIVGQGVLNQLKSESGIFYHVFPGSIITNASFNAYAHDGMIYRLSAMYDEPGVVGTISALLLVADRLKLKCWRNKILLVGGLCSFSLAFISIMILYSILRKKVHYTIIIFGFGLILLALFQGMNNSAINSYFIERMAVDDGMLVGARREGVLLDYYMDEYIGSSLPQIIFGMDKDVVGDVGSSWKIILIKYGVLGFVGLLVFFLIYALINMKNVDVLIFLVVFIASIYQRPHVWMFPMVLIYVCGISNLNSYIGSGHKFKHYVPARKRSFLAGT